MEELDPLDPVQVAFTGEASNNQPPPNSVRGSWRVSDPQALGDVEREVTILRVHNRHADQLDVSVVYAGMPLLAKCRGCECCGRPWVSQLYPRGLPTQPGGKRNDNVIGLWHRDLRLAVAAAAHAIAVSNGMKPTPVPR